ncbi:hybrid sensor histidine kinase/response regulator, partial [Pseudomonas syringae]
LKSLLPGWGLEYQQRSIDDLLIGLDPDVVITDCPECLFGLRPTYTAPILLVTAYGSFMPSEEAAALAPLQQQARPLARNALYLT